jgi:DNA-binding MarR family transcriptional regulator
LPPILPKRASRDVAPDVLSKLIGAMMSHIHRRSAGDTLAVLNDAGLTMAQLVALHALEHAGGRSVGSIGGCLGLSPATTSHLVDRLVQEGLVERREDPGDRRQKRVEITATGRRLVARVESTRTREFASVLSQLSPELRRQLAEILVRVNEELAALPQESA